MHQNTHIKCKYFNFSFWGGTQSAPEITSVIGRQDLLTIYFRCVFQPSLSSSYCPPYATPLHALLFLHRVCDSEVETVWLFD